MNNTRNEQKAKELWDKLPEALNQLGYTELRDAQVPCIDSIFGGEDVMCICPTGLGKTALALIPTILNEYRTIVFSPLIALMADQVQSCNRKHVRAGAINSSQSEAENSIELSEWTNGSTQVLYVAPERIENPQFRAAMRMVRPDLIVIDECHCLDQWGTNFRPAYVAVGAFAQEFQPKQVLALTATATQQTVRCVKEVLQLPSMRIERHYTPRTNLHLSSSVCTDAMLFGEVYKKLQEVKGSAIVYCPTVQQVIKLTEFLQQAGESVTFYHGQITQQAVKDTNQNDFMSGRVRIMVATNAFGMGIDKADIEAVIHAGIPGSLEAVAQETGRAARDGRDAICHMFFTEDAFQVQTHFWARSNPSSEEVQTVYNELELLAVDNIAKITVSDLEVRLSDDVAVQGALNNLVAYNCIERVEPEGKVASFGFNSFDMDALPKTKKAIVSYILDEGFKDGDLFQVDMNLLEQHIRLSRATVNNHIRQMVNDGTLKTYVPPFRGKVTKLLRPPTKNELLIMDIRRSDERDKLELVKQYALCRDSRKQDLLSEYFDKQFEAV